MVIVGSILNEDELSPPLSDLGIYYLWYHLSMNNKYTLLLCGEVTEAYQFINHMKEWKIGGRGRERRGGGRERRGGGRERRGGGRYRQTRRRKRKKVGNEIQ